MSGNISMECDELQYLEQLNCDKACRQVDKQYEKQNITDETRWKKSLQSVMVHKQPVPVPGNPS